MTPRLTEKPISLLEGWYQPSDQEQVCLWWLGQAGFALRYGDLSIVIDPYLSNYLASKYQGSKFPHKRMMQPPVKPGEFKGVDFILCTHRHTDHMDPETLLPMLEANPGCRVIVPRAEYEWALEIGINQQSLLTANEGDTIPHSPDFSVTALASAHEELKTNQAGEHHFLGYVIQLGSLRIYHSGDCVPYPGLKGKLQDQKMNLALLPVNGRDEFRTVNGILGNFHLLEAVQLCEEASIHNLICHHYGMFDFNTINPRTLAKALNETPDALNAMAVQMGIQYRLSN